MQYELEMLALIIGPPSGSWFPAIRELEELKEQMGHHTSLSRATTANTKV